MMRANDRIDRAGGAAMCTSDTAIFVNECNAARLGSLLDQWQDIFAEQISQPAHCLVAAWRAEIDRHTVVDNRGGIRAAARVTALRTLCLRQQIVYLLNEVGGLRGQRTIGVTQRQSGKQCQRRDCNDGCHGRAIPANPMNASDMMPAVMRAIAVPRKGEGISAASSRSRIEANMTSTNANPAAAPKPKNTD